MVGQAIAALVQRSYPTSRTRDWPTDAVKSVNGGSGQIDNTPRNGTKVTASTPVAVSEQTTSSADAGKRRMRKGQPSAVSYKTTLTEPELGVAGDTPEPPLAARLVPEQRESGLAGYRAP